MTRTGDFCSFTRMTPPFLRRATRVLATGALTFALAAPAIAVSSPFINDALLTDPSLDAASAPAVVTDSQGVISAAWAAGSTVRVSTRPVGGAPWTAPAVINGGGAVADVDLAVSAGGDLTVIWTTDGGQIRTSSLPVGGAWSAPTNTSAEDTLAKLPRIVYAGSNPVAFWLRTAGGRRTLQTAEFQPNGVWTPTRDLSDFSRLAVSYDVAAGTPGNVVATWLQSGEVKSRYRTVAGVWEDEKVISDPSSDAAEPHVTVDTGGDAYIVFLQGFGAVNRVHVRRKAAGEGWSPAERLSTIDGVDSAAVDIAADGARGVRAIWIRGNGTSARVVSTYRSPTTGAWTVPFYLTGNAAGYRSPAIAGDALHRAVATWAREGDAFMIEAAVDPLDAAGNTSWQAPTAISPSINNPQALATTLSPAGDGVIIWQQGGVSGFPFRVRGEGVDLNPPVIRAIRVPANALPGRAFVVAVGTTDSWGVAAVNWAFGDGGSATGPRAEHSYAAAGTYTVTVTVTDLAGQTTADDRIVVVKIPPDCSQKKVGTSGADEIVGTEFGDSLDGLAGNDTIRGLAGNDCLFGRDGADKLRGGTGTDVLRGGEGADSIIGGAGSDNMYGGAGNDKLIARDDRRDLVDCGIGTNDVAYVDRLDIVRNCETVRRR